MAPRPETAGTRQLQKYGGVNRARCVIRRKDRRARKGAPYENRTLSHKQDWHLPLECLAFYARGTLFTVGRKARPSSLVEDEVKDGNSTMSVTREELQQAGASPELARILADRWPRRDPSNLTRNPMAVAFLVAFLGALGWLVLGVTGTQADIAILQSDVAVLKIGQAKLEQDIADLRQEMLAGQAMLESKLNRILEK